MTDAEARRLCLLEMADRLAVEGAQGQAAWATHAWTTRDGEGTAWDELSRARIRRAAESLVQQWRDEAAEASEQDGG